MRKAMARTFLGWCIVYLPHYLALRPADFHRELIALLESDAHPFLSIAGFRGSAKSVFASLALPLWATLEHPTRYPFVLPFADTAVQGTLTIANIRHELETNELIKQDYGDLSDGVSKNVEWTKNSLLLNNGARILARSRGQRIRGLRHREHRPSLVILDDPEELEKVQKKEYRDKTERWLRGELIPAIEESRARLIVVGNVLHTDALMARLKHDTLFTHKDYPLIDGEGRCTWTAKYPTEKALKMQEAKVGHISWMREYLLKVVPPEGQEVREEWLTYYDRIPEGADIQRTGVGVDLAISKAQTADYTSMVGGVATIEEGLPVLYVLPNPVNERLSFHETLGRMKTLSTSMRDTFAQPTFFIEAVAYQKVAIEEALRNGLPAEPMKVGSDKRARLRSASVFIQNGMVRFPRKGCEDLIAQILGFGIEDHDDLMDAFVYLVLGLRTEGMDRPEVISLL
jgi:phage terminase large subunit-like protein